MLVLKPLQPQLHHTQVALQMVSRDQGRDLLCLVLLKLQMLGTVLQVFHYPSVVMVPATRTVQMPPMAQATIVVPLDLGESAMVILLLLLFQQTVPVPLTLLALCPLLLLFRLLQLLRFHPSPRMRALALASKQAFSLRSSVWH